MSSTEAASHNGTDSGTAADPAAPTTFLFLADPQQWRSDNDPSPNYRKQSCSDLNVALNALDSSSYPTNFGLSCGGKPIGSVNVVFFGGDLCQTGGDYSAEDQFLHVPPTFHGGSELVKARALYQAGFSNDQGVTLLKYNPKYFGLGNHDVQSDYTPAVGWYKGRWAGDFSLPHNYWRYQMWNFITQMHTGYDQLLLPASKAVYPIGWQNIDSDAGKGTFEYEDHSLNYVVDLGPVDVFQLHVYGGDSDNDRESGIDWLKGKLAERGQTRPIIIVQHYLFSETIENGGITPCWTNAQRDALVTILAPYNIIAFLVGHNHGVGPFPNSIPVPTQNPTRFVPEFRPGCAFNQNFALVRVTPSTLDVLYGTAASQKISWTYGGTFAVPFANEIWEEDSNWNGNYFGTLKSIYVDTRRVMAPTGKVIVGCTLARTVSPDPTNRLTWVLKVANLDGSGEQTVNVSGDGNKTYFPGEGGMSKIYVDLSPVTCPTGSVVVGVFSWQKNNRIAPGLVVRNISSGQQTEMTNTEWKDYFPGEGGSTHLYADTNVVRRPGPGIPGVPSMLQMGGVALYQKGGNRVAVKVLYT
ncbi:hypothetical protein FA95DRAFT_1562619 [Auriscalpium vulgare]|uniref:Uncharacterized protein n=1 Tax=Auriscalpium vulgare TaxID=40419 RepID=A0ACB8RJJ1_9AGAM|nr:hypothetical protein FA95DRAFT_1562619 [Auriscalpium vulgare]